MSAIIYKGARYVLASQLVTRENLLKELVNLGKRLSEQANPESYPSEYRERAKPFEKKLQAARWAYKMIRDGKDPIATLKKLEQVMYNGIEANTVHQLLNLIKTNGFQS